MGSSPFRPTNLGISTKGDQLAFNQEQNKDIDEIVSFLGFLKAEKITITDLTTIDCVAVSVFGLIDDGPNPKKRDGFYGTWNFEKIRFDWIPILEGGVAN